MNNIFSRRRTGCLHVFQCTRGKRINYKIRRCLWDNEFATDDVLELTMPANSKASEEDAALASRALKELLLWGVSRPSNPFDCSEGYIQYTRSVLGESHIHIMRLRVLQVETLWFLFGQLASTTKKGIECAEVSTLSSEHFGFQLEIITMGTFPLFKLCRSPAIQSTPDHLKRTLTYEQHYLSISCKCHHAHRWPHERREWVAKLVGSRRGGQGLLDLRRG